MTADARSAKRRLGYGRRAAIAVALALAGCGMASSGAAIPRQSPPPRVVDRVAVYPLRVSLDADGRLRARALGGRLLTLARTADVWEEIPLATEPLPPARTRTLRRGERPPSRCGSLKTRRNLAAYPPLRLSAKTQGVSVAAVLAFARRAPARRLVGVGQTEQVEGCASAQATSAVGTRIDAVLPVLAASTRRKLLIGWLWGMRARRGAVAVTGDFLRGRALARGRGELGGGQGPAQIPSAGFERYLSNQVFGLWEARPEVAARGPAGNVAMGLFELPLRGRVPGFRVEVAVAYREE